MQIGGYTWQQLQIKMANADFDIEEFAVSSDPICLFGFLSDDFFKPTSFVLLVIFKHFRA